MSYLTVAQQFLVGRLDRAEWTHEAHLAAGVVTLLAARSLHPATDAGRAAAAAAARTELAARITAHNDEVGTLNTDQSGYHETLTWFYLDRLSALLDEAGVFADRLTRAQLDEIIAGVLTRPEVSRTAAFAAYGESVLHSAAARRRALTPAEYHASEGPAGVFTTAA
jgi:hypothetical protein